MKKILLLVFLATYSFCSEPTSSPFSFTGSLLAPPGVAIKQGDFLFQNYLFMKKELSNYELDENYYLNRRNLSSYFELRYFFGLNSFCDVNIISRLFLNKSRDAFAFNIGDVVLGLDFQFLDPDEFEKIPGIKFSVREVFPTGRYNRLRASKDWADLTGEGSFKTQFDLLFYKLFHVRNQQWMTTKFSMQYTLCMPCDVHGFSYYGGGFGCSGKVLPGSEGQAMLSFEYSLNKTIALNLDQIFLFKEKSHFYGRSGIGLHRKRTYASMPFSYQFQLAPGIEFLFSNKLGINLGAWVSVLGKNSLQFVSGVMNVNYAY